MARSMQRNVRSAGAALAVMLALALAGALVLSPGGINTAWAAKTGTDTSQGTASMAAGKKGGGEDTWNESVLTVDDDWVYCADIDTSFTSGKTVKKEDPVKTGRWKQSLVTKMALAAEYVWDGKFKSSKKNSDGHKVTSKYEKYVVTQILVWYILNDAGYTNYKYFTAEVDGNGLFGDDDGREACWKYVEENKKKKIGHATYYSGSGTQDVVCNFKTEPALGGIELIKRSADELVTGSNSCYSLKGAEYGIFEKESDAKAKAADNALRICTTDEDGHWSTGEEFEVGTYYVAETKPPKGFDIDNNVYSVKVVAGESVRVNKTHVADTPLLGGIELDKTSVLPNITDNNKCYSLKGARYGVFKSDYDAHQHDEARAVKVYETGENGVLKGPKELPGGTYYVSETKAPVGFTRNNEVYEVFVAPGEIVRVGDEGGRVSDVPQTNPVELWIAKTDAETTDGGAQGSATLEGTQFEIAYYDGYYDLSNLPAQATRTWIVKSDAQGKARASDELFVSGDDFYRTADGRITIPLGTITAREKEPPRGYLFGDGANEAGGVALARIETDTLDEELTLYTAPGVTDYVKRGGVAVGKVDRQNGQYLAQGASTLEGAVFEIVTDNDQQVIVHGTRYVKGDVVDSITTRREDDGRYIARTSDDLLPVGDYTLREVESTEGHLLDAESRDWRAHFTISEDGEVVDLTDPTDCVSNQVIRGDFGFSKVDGQTSARLGNVAFLVTSETTGEEHVIVTDENGMVSTAASWNAHTAKTNANDAALIAMRSETVAGESSESGESSETSNSGEAADGDSVAATSEGSSSASANASSSSAASSSTSEDETASSSSSAAGESTVGIAGAESDTTTESGDPSESQAQGESPSASAASAETAGEGSSSSASSESAEDSNDDAASSDAESSSNADAKKPSSAKSAHEVDDELLDASAGVWFCGRTDAPVPADDALGALPYDTYRVRELRSSANEGYELAEFTVRVSRDARELDLGTVDDNAGPFIGTTLTDANDVQLAPSASIALLKDKVYYNNLDARQKYTLRGEIHLVGADGADGGVIAEGAATFGPQGPDGTTDVEFSIDTSDLGGAHLVAFERLYDAKNNIVAVHEDLNDEGQTVRVPQVGTTLVDGADGDHGADANDAITLVDHVAFRGLTPFVTYTVAGTLHLRNDDGTDAGPALDSQGAEITATQTFSPETAEGEVDIAFTFAAPNLAGKTVVAFEELTRNGQTYAVHADISDEGQTVRFTPPHVEEGEPPEPEPENPPLIKEQDNGKPSEKSGSPEKSGLPKTGDLIDLVPIVGTALAALGLLIAALCIRTMQRNSEIYINRGPKR